MTHSPVVAPRQVELLVSPMSGTIGAAIDHLFPPEGHDAARWPQARSTKAQAGR